MQVILILLLFTGTVQSVLLMNLSAAPGLSVQNGLLYLLCLLLIYQFANANLKIELRALHGAFCVLIGYSLISWAVAAFVIRYPGYGFIRPAMQLKNGLIDHVLVFAVFFYGTRTVSDALLVLKMIALVALIGNGAMILDVFGIIDSPAIYLDDGRLEGPFGEPNQHGAFSIMLLPAMAALFQRDRGPARILWIMTALAMVATLIMGASRGALVGLVAAAIWGAILFRRFVTPGRILAWMSSAIVLASIMAIVVGGDFVELFQERFVKTGDVDAQTATSGRTRIWGLAIGRMLEVPLTLITGFGWDVYRSMPFRYAPHNHYLWLWFNVGIVGVASSLVIYQQIISTARKAANVATTQVRPHLIAFVFGFLGLLFALIFLDMHFSWLYIWAYIGLIMRIAVIVMNETEVSIVSTTTPVKSGSTLTFSSNARRPNRH